MHFLRHPLHSKRLDYADITAKLITTLSSHKTDICCAPACLFSVLLRSNKLHLPWISYVRSFYNLSYYLTLILKFVLFLSLAQINVCMCVHACVCMHVCICMCVRMCSYCNHLPKTINIVQYVSAMKAENSVGITC